MAQWRGPFPTPESRRPTAVFPAQVTAAGPLLREVEEGLRTRLQDVPALLVWGDRDPVFRQRDLRRWQRLLPHARTEHLPEASHFLQDDDPEGMAAAVLGWWADAAA